MTWKLHCHKLFHSVTVYQFNHLAPLCICCLKLHVTLIRWWDLWGVGWGGGLPRFGGGALCSNVFTTWCRTLIWVDKGISAFNAYLVCIMTYAFRSFQCMFWTSSYCVLSIYGRHPRMSGNSLMSIFLPIYCALINLIYREPMFAEKCFGLLVAYPFPYPWASILLIFQNKPPGSISAGHASILAYNG